MGGLKRARSNAAAGCVTIWAGQEQPRSFVAPAFRIVVKTGKRSVEVSYGLTNLTPDDAQAPQLEALWRGHWTIENGVHYVRDVTMGEDRCQIATGNAPRALAALRSGLIDLFRQQGWANIADAIRHYGASVARVLLLLGAIPTRL